RPVTMGRCRCGKRRKEKSTAHWRATLCVSEALTRTDRVGADEAIIGEGCKIGYFVYYRTLSGDFHRNLAHATLSEAKRIGPSVADAQWKNVNLTLLPWSQVSILG